MPCVLVGVLISYFLLLSMTTTNKNDDLLLKYYKTLLKDIDYSVFDKLVHEIKAENIRNNLK